MAPMFTRILVPTDFSATADAALEYARMLAEEFGASLHVLHVLDDPLAPSGLLADIYTPELPDVRHALMQEAQTRLAFRVPKGSKCTAAGEVVFGNGTGTIVQYAESLKADLIVMGTHGRTGLKHFMMGSVAEEVVRSAPCPVLTVRHPDATAAVPVGARAGTVVV